MAGDGSVYRTPPAQPALDVPQDDQENSVLSTFTPRENRAFGYALGVMVLMLLLLAALMYPADSPFRSPEGY